MSDFQHFIAVLPDPFVNLTQDHCREDFDVISYVAEWERGQVTRATIEIPNPGAALYRQDAPRGVVILESPDGTIGSARVLLRGFLQPFLRTDGEKNGYTVHVEIQAAPVDVKNRVFQRALSTDMVKPQWDPIIEDLSYDDPENCLQGWGAYYNVDPVTHGITREDFIDADQTYYIDDDTDVESQKLTDGPPPVARVVQRVSCEYEQYCLALVNAAGAIGVVSTMNADHFEGMGERTDASKYLNVNTGGGWTVDRTSASGACSQSPHIYTGRKFAANYGVGAVRTVPVTNADGSAGEKQIGSVSYGHQMVDELAAMWITSYTWDYYWLKTEYRQPRKELITLYMDMPLQQVSGVKAREDLGTLNCKDLLLWEYPNPTPPPPPDANGDYKFPYSATMQAKPHDNYTVYEKGDICTYGGYGYQCTADGTHGYLYNWPIPAGKLVVSTKIKNVSYYLTPQLAKGWKQIPWGGAINDTRTPSFFDTQRGLEVVQHALMRMRAFLRSRLQSQILSFGCAWETGWFLTGRDQVRVRYYDPATRQGRFVHGKVRSYRKRIDAKGKWCEFSVGLCVGTGQADTLAQTGPTKAVAATISPDTWFQTVAARDRYIDRIASILEFNTDYPLDKLGTYAVSDVAWTYGADPLFVPVDAYRLGQASYAVVSVSKTNMAGDQFGRASAYGYSLRDPRNAPRDFPTHVDVYMRDVQSGGTLERAYHGVAQLVVSPKGIDLMGGDA